MPPQPEPSQFLAPAAGHAGNPKAAAILPLGPPAVMIACVTAVAPCQVQLIPLGYTIINPFRVYGEQLQELLM